jgi:hypothetical protein
MVVTQLWRYPVKSLRGEALQSADFVAGGIPFDRSAAVIDPNPLRLGKPLTGRLEKRLLGYASSVRGDTVMVRTPSGGVHHAGDSAWTDEFEQETGAAASVQFFSEPVHDAADVLVINAASARALAEEYGAHVDPMRFRPNIILDGPDAIAFEEEKWVGGSFGVGDTVLNVVYPCERCVMTTIDPTTLAMDPKFLRLVVEKHSACFGVYCRVESPGSAKIGDAWRLVSGPEAK